MATPKEKSEIPLSRRTLPYPGEIDLKGSAFSESRLAEMRVAHFEGWDGAKRHTTECPYKGAGMLMFYIGQNSNKDPLGVQKSSIGVVYIPKDMGQYAGTIKFKVPGPGKHSVYLRTINKIGTDRDYEEKLKIFLECIKSASKLLDVETTHFNLFKRCHLCGRLNIMFGRYAQSCYQCHPRIEHINEESKERSKRIEAGGYVYVCTDGQYVKIGMTKNDPKIRVLGLSTMYHKKFTLLACAKVDNARVTERKAHLYFAKKRVKGEWFNVAPQLAIDYLRNIHRSSSIFCIS